MICLCGISMRYCSTRRFLSFHHSCYVFLIANGIAPLSRRQIRRCIPNRLCRCSSLTFKPVLFSMPLSILRLPVPIGTSDTEPPYLSQEYRELFFQIYVFLKIRFQHNDITLNVSRHFRCCSFGILSKFTITALKSKNMLICLQDISSISFSNSSFPASVKEYTAFSGIFPSFFVRLVISPFPLTGSPFCIWMVC